MDAFPGIVIGFIVIVAAIVIGTIVFSAAKGVSQWNYNNQQPVLRVPVTLIAKRSDVQVRHRHHDNHVHHRTYSEYFATFELENGQRMEFELSGEEFGLLVEGDKGELTHQGTRYHGFTRILSDGTRIGPPANNEPAVPPGELSGAKCIRCETPMLVGRSDCAACGWTQPAS